MDNYIVINGKKAELTEEQLKALGIEVPNIASFRRAKEGEDYWYIDPMGKVSSFVEDFSGFDTWCYDVANYCTDKAIMEQRALHETLNRLLWRFSMEHDGDKINWDKHSFKYYIYFDIAYKGFLVGLSSYCKTNNVYFYTEEIAEQAIKTIVKPFMKEHPDFKW